MTTEHSATLHSATLSAQSVADQRPALERRLDPQIRKLAVGVWTAELVGEELANISYGGRPVLRAIKAVVRDHEWRTFAPSVRDLAELKDDDGVSLRLHVDYAAPGSADAAAPAFEAMLMLRITPAIVEVSFSGRAKTAFRRNRIGLVVLHPTSEAGREVSAVSPDGNVTAGAFPADIRPDLVFKDIASLEWADAGTAFDLGFSGDIFETEDQRNWSDGSFKTYSTPSALPIPVDIAAGDTVHQSVSLEALSIETPDNPAAGGYDRVPFTVGEPVGTVPALALSVDPAGADSTGADPAGAAAANAGEGVQLPGLDAVLVELYEPRELWPGKLAAAAREADRHGAALDVRVVSASADGVAEALSGALGGQLSRVVRLGLFHPETQCTDPAAWTALKEPLQLAGFSGQLLAGTRSHFTELNRWIAGGGTPVPQDADALAFSLTPQVHSTEIPHIVETIPIHGVAAANAVRLGEGRPVHVGPVTLKPRFHAPGQHADGDELQDHSFTAAWTLASLHALTSEGVASVTYFEAGSPRGIAAADGTLNPVGELLQKLAACKGEPVLAATQQRVQRHAGKSLVTVYPVQSAAGLQVFLGNLSPREATAVLSLPGGANAAAEVTVIGAAAGATAVADPADDGATAVTLRPWSTTVVTFGD
ncbi:hypothetical protein FCN77_02015 [Arthrobacter sp. 24S4-2]|uniref:hypothetical protein n=1 Tax=Arthrobacter sp. 24S4-2 TaxID=2575374 RepID=UPI0010C7D10F|nr:hypothetical protein [Arthrobacter sp. 24S4-2]QCO96720.1 hypothetical protein FCN77_02015 [Arthrobacter sp. 24S4-2]